MARSIDRRREGVRERERELVLAFQSGDAQAYDSIDRSCRPAAERIARRLLVNPADVEEAVQETMVRAYQGLPRFNGSYALTAWVARIATNVCLDTLRARSRRPVSAGALEPNMDAPNGHDGNGHHADPEELFEQAADAQEVRKVLAELPERHRTALVLREFEGYSHRRIALMLDTSPERVKALIHRAKAGFKRAWGEEGNGGRLAAFAPLLIPINWVRRFFGRAPEFDYPSTASAANVASSPVAQTFTVVASERISTAVAAVMLAGTVGFVVHNAPRVSEAKEAAVIELVQAPAPAETANPVVEHKEKNGPPKHHPAEQADTLPAPVASVPPPDEIEEDVVLEDADEPTAPEDVVDPSPDPPPHPQGFGYSFASDRTADGPCECDAGPHLTQNSISISEQGLSSYEASLGAAISDSTGAPAWPVSLSIDASNDRVSLYFEIRTQYGVSPFDASGVQATMTEDAWGGWTYTYDGHYEWRGGPGEHADAPHKGSFTATLTFSWIEQRLVWAGIDLHETG
ncbi:MAG: RNA polymerase sigma factor [Actinomycetota bacterium]